MAFIKPEKIVTKFHLTLEPEEYRIILSALDDYLDTLEVEREEGEKENSDVHFGFDNNYIDKVSLLYKTVENGIEGLGTI